MRLAIILLAILLIFSAGCSTVKEPANTVSTVAGISELSLSGQDLAQLGMKNNGTDCKVEVYQTSESTSLAQYSMCTYSVNSLNDTEIIIELSKFTNTNDLNGSYQYGSSHLYGASGLMAENTFGDQSRFRVNSKDDYGGELNDPNMYYYHLWICKDTYLIHITSSGTNKDAKDTISSIGQEFMKKFK